MKIDGPDGSFLQRIAAALPGMLAIFDVERERTVFVNGAVESVLGYAPEQINALNGDLIAALLHPDDLESYRKRAQHFPALTEGESVESEYRLRHADGSYRWLCAREVVLSRDETGRASQILSVALDVSAHKEAEATLARNEERWSIALDAARLGFFDWDVATRQGGWNAWHFRLMGLEPADRPQRLEDIVALLHPDDRERMVAAVRRTVEAHEPFELEGRILADEGEKVHWIAAAGGVTARDENGAAKRISGVIWDISARKAIEEELQRAHDELEARVEQRTRELADTVAQLRREVEQRQGAEATRSHLLTRLVSAQEEERRRISRELHDQMGQTLTAMLMSIDALALDAAPQLSPDLQERCKRVRDLAAGLMDQMHYLAWELRPAALDNLGLPVALRQSLGEWGARSGVATDFVTRGLGEERLAPHLETAFYRVAQEALGNIARHAGAQNVSIILEGGDHQVVLIVEDDGRGFNPTAIGEDRLGLLGMRERMEAVGGTLEIESQPGEGAAIFARAALERPSQSQSRGRSEVS